MKFHHILSFLLVVLFTSGLNAQHLPPSATFVSETGVYGLPTLSTNKSWSVELVNKTASDHVYSIPKEEIMRQKAELHLKRLASNHKTNNSAQRSDLKPIIGVNYEGNIQGNNVPPDNAMAVSTNGFIISAINSNIIFANTTGKTTFTQDLTDFFTFLNVGSSIYDPRILYDVEMNRFIVLALHGNTATTTKIVTAFSKTEDPSAGWYYYNFDGNPLEDLNWFDYPNVGLTQKNLFITGLMRNFDGDWQYSVIYQIDKKKCFAGEAASWSYYGTVNNADGSKAFNMVPAHSAWKTLPPAKMYFVSNVAQGGNRYHLFSIEGNVNENPTLDALEVSGPQTALAPDGIQKNTGNVLNTFDSRIWNAMELNGIVHFGAHVNSPDNTSALFYGRFDIANKKVYGSLYHQAGFDYGFPSIAAFGKEETDNKVLINFLKTGASIFASQGAIICEGENDVFDWGQEVITKTGTNYIDALNENRERWGDYTTVCRRFWSDKTGSAEIWSTGCFGKGGYGTWLTQFHSDSSVYFADFDATKTTLNPGNTTAFTSVSSNTVKRWLWTFENAVPSTSTIANPTVKYSNVGQFDVSLKLVFDHNGSEDSVTYVKNDFITVMEAVLAPIADFTADKDTVYQGESVAYFDNSKNEVLSYAWSFQNGIPATSFEKNPVIRYEKKGAHLVNLKVKNTAGENTKLKQKFVTVLELKPPVAAFEANKTNAFVNDDIFFTDLTSNLPDNRSWYFPGGNPSTSNEKFPTVRYEAEGSYDVKLVVSNFAGKDSLTRSAYITIGTSATTETETWLSAMTLFPNPAHNNDKIMLRFNLIKATEMQFLICSTTGQSIKNLVRQRVKAGDNELSFSTTALIAGSYVLIAKEVGGRQKAIPFVVEN